MANNQPPRVFTDGELRDFLAGTSDRDLSNAIDTALENDSALAERLAAFAPTPELGSAVDAAFANLLDAAPTERLNSMLSNAADAATPPARKPVATNETPSFWSTLGRLFAAEQAAATAIGFALFLGVGLVVGRTTAPTQIVEVPTPPPAEVMVEKPKTPGWLVAVSDYFKLFTAETYASAQVDDAAKQRSLAFVSERIALDISKAPNVPGLSLQRAELLDLKGKPLAQIGYVDEQGRPVAICIIYRGAAMKPETAPPPPSYKAHEVDKFNIVNWDVQPHGFLVIGDLPQEELETLARQVHETLI